MNKMKHTKKLIKITAVILLMTLGVFAIKNYVFSSAGGLKWSSPLDMLLLLPALPFIFIELPLEPAWLTILVVFGGSSAFWIFVAYIVGKYLDKNKK